MAHIKKFTDDVAQKIINNLSEYPTHKPQYLSDTTFHRGDTILYNNPNDYYREKRGMIGIKSNTITLVGIIINISNDIDLSIKKRNDLEIELANFLLERYGAEHIISAIATRKSLKYYFMPIINSSSISQKAKSVELYLYEHPSATNTEVAKALGISRDTVRRWRNVNDYKSAKFSAKKILNQNDFRTFHKDLAIYLDENFEDRLGNKVGRYFYHEHK